MTDYKSKIFAHMELDGALVKMQVDSGASCNVLLLENFYRKIPLSIGLT